MPARNGGRLATIAACGTIAWALSVMPHATPRETIRVWRIGSPHRGNTPDTSLSGSFREALDRRALSATVEAFPARGFASTFLDAVTRNAAPDVLAFDNFGVIEGLTVGRERFDGIGEMPMIRRDLIRVTTAFDALLGPERGWTYLFSTSPNHAAARAFALTAPDCGKGLSRTALQSELADLVPALATAYLEGHASTVHSYSDPDGLPPAPVMPESVDVAAVGSCGIWGNHKLAFVQVQASYEGERTIGRMPVVMVLRNPSSQWQLLAAARDPVSNGAFIKDVSAFAALLDTDRQPRALPASAALLSPPDGHFPIPSAGQRFGMFTWRSSVSDAVIGEIAEFAYKDNARLFLRRAPQPESLGGISAGKLWTTNGSWNWRIWSITRAGDVAFSEARSFVH